MKYLSLVFLVSLLVACAHNPEPMPLKSFTYTVAGEDGATVAPTPAQEAIPAQSRATTKHVVAPTPVVQSLTPADIRENNSAQGPSVSAKTQSPSTSAEESSSLADKVDKAFRLARRTARDVRRNTARIASLEDRAEYNHPGEDVSTASIFSSGGITISANYAEGLDKLADEVKTGKKKLLMIVGYADSQKGDNKSLSVARAKAVAEYLKQKGVNLSGVLVEGRGATKRFGYHSLRSNRNVRIITQRL